MTSQAELERKLARVLLIELMAHQFSYPVRWIETQDAILGKTGSERIVEIGPTTTLLGMMKRTIHSKFKTHDFASSIQRKLLSSEKDVKDIYYEHDEVLPAAKEEPVAKGAIASTADHKQQQQQQQQLSTPVPAPVHKVASVEDRPMSAKELIFTIVSRALKQSVADISESSTIKSLASGRSTLENEIIGDLGAEFGSLPDRAEDIPLKELSDSLQASFKPRMGKVATKLLNSLFSSKMPGGFNVTTARQYLKSRWGFESGRQDSCLVLAAAMQPASRVSSDGEAKAFFDSVVQKYSAQQGLDLNAAAAAGSAGGASSAATVVDPEALKALTANQNQMMSDLLDLYAKQLGVDLQEDRRNLETFRETVDRELKVDLDMLTQEHGEEYIAGVRPRFDSQKTRRYDSAWSWARQDLLQLYYRVSKVSSETQMNAVELQDIMQRCSHIANASDGGVITILDNMTKDMTNQFPLSIFRELREKCQLSLRNGPTYRCIPRLCAPCTIVTEAGDIEYSEKARTDSVCFADLALPPRHQLLPGRREPHLHLKCKTDFGWEFDEDLTDVYRQALDQAGRSGESFSGRAVLITGAGPGSIGAEMLRGLLSGGARVAVTTSQFSSKVARKYQELYTQYGARGSELVVIPFNQASVQDVTSLVDYIFDPQGLNWDLDHIVPFAAIPENGRSMDNIDGKSELAHRIMLVNLLRLLGSVKAHKEARNFNTRPTQVILPLSPNHGLFGGDGLYSESKLALETLFNRWYSEDWGAYLSICGAVIGWTRGTGLMNKNDMVAEGIEKKGVRTFSQEEMSCSLLSLMFRSVAELCEEEPVYADLTGGMGRLKELPTLVQTLRKELKEEGEVCQALLEEARCESECSVLVEDQPSITQNQHRNVDFRIDFPPTLDYEKEVAPLSADLRDMVDLERVVVVTGFSELGPHGNARTRWEIETNGEFSLEGCIEMAWIMGMIKHHTGTINGKPFSGWIDSQSKEPVVDRNVKKLYEERILAHSGIRLIEPELFNGYNPEKKQFLHEVIIQDDLKPIEMPETTALQMKHEHGDSVDIRRIGDSELYTVQLKKGAKLLIPKAMKFDRLVAGQIPTGWDPKIYGIPDDIIQQVDKVTLYTLVCAAEALLSSGIVDPYEVYEYIHVSEAGNCIGSALGGLNALQKFNHGRRFEQEIQQDILQESFINTIAAWVNMLLMSSSGPIRSPVGACATSIESLELGYDTLVSGKAKFCFVGGVDDFNEELSYEFANMKATSNGAEELAKGRSPAEMSRPAASTRAGFMEAHGCGLQVLTTAKLALQMGLPIRGIVAFCGTASDKAGRSVPAPGKGILTNARELPTDFPSPLLDISVRRKRLNLRKRQIADARGAALEELDLTISGLKSQRATTAIDIPAYRENRIRQIEESFVKERRDAQYTLGNSFWQNDPSIAPLRGSLATWGLTINDLTVASFHGTSTVLNEKNESNVIHSQLQTLGRTPGNVILGVFQKSLTGHSKAAAGAWMLNGALQMLESGIVPGNRNADNIDRELRKYEHIAFLNQTLQTHGVKAVSVTSFGFGQKGAQAICIHPMYLFATVSREQYEEYELKRAVRQKKTDVFFYQAVTSNSIFRAKTLAPYAAEQEENVLLNPSARFVAESRT